MKNIDKERHERNAKIQVQPSNDNSTFESYNTVVENQNPQAGKRNENILCAVLALLKELDQNGLELVKRDIQMCILYKAQCQEFAEAARPENMVPLSTMYLAATQAETASGSETRGTGIPQC